MTLQPSFRCSFFEKEQIGWENDTKLLTTFVAALFASPKHRDLPGVIVPVLIEFTGQAQSFPCHTYCEAPSFRGHIALGPEHSNFHNVKRPTHEPI